MNLWLYIPAFAAIQSLLREERIRGRNLWMFQTVVIFMAVYLPVVSGLFPEDREIFFRIQQGYLVSPTSGASVLITLDRTAYALYLAEYLFIQVFSIVNLTGYLKSLENYYSDLDARTLVRYRSISSLAGAQLNTEVVLFKYLKTTWSIGYAHMFGPGGLHRGDWLFSLKLL